MTWQWMHRHVVVCVCVRVARGGGGGRGYGWVHTKHSLVPGRGRDLLPDVRVPVKAGLVDLPCHVAIHDPLPGSHTRKLVPLVDQGKHEAREAVGAVEGATVSEEHRVRTQDLRVGLEWVWARSGVGKGQGKRGNGRGAWGRGGGNA